MTTASAARPIAVLTGGTSGLGRPLARGLAAAGWHLVLVARDEARTRDLVASLAAELPGATAEIEVAELSVLSEVRRAAAAIAARHPAIGLLVLNAGTFQTRRRVTAEGHELVVAVNHLAPFVLVQALQGPLRAGCARVVAVGSSTSDRARIDPGNLELTRGWIFTRAYAQSKLALMIACFGWAARLAPEVTVNVVHPGMVATGLIRVGGPIGLAWKLIGRFALTPEQGAATPLRAATDPGLAGVTGRYLVPGGFGSANRRASDPVLAAAVWRETERLVVTPADQAPQPVTDAAAQLAQP